MGRPVARLADQALLAATLGSEADRGGLLCAAGGAATTPEIENPLSDGLVEALRELWKLIEAADRGVWSVQIVALKGIRGSRHVGSSELGRLLDNRDASEATCQPANIAAKAGPERG